MNLKRDPLEGIRPAGKPDFCFYCSEKLPGEHKADCVIPRRSVVVKLETTFVVAVPRHWTIQDIEFHRNDGTWCTDNMIREMARAADAGGPCFCHSKITVEREATLEDHESMPCEAGMELE